MADATTEAAAEALLLPDDDGSIPNNPDLPVLLYRGAIPPARASAEAFESLFGRNGWGDGWRNGIYGFHHYHSEAHEVLGIARGGARVQLGGSDGVILEVAAGDVVVIPAGVGHKRLSPAGDLLVIGAYPPGQQPDLRRGGPDDRPEVLDNIRRVPLPAADPVQGRDGALLRHWQARR